jgi:hypothetical protein
MIYMSLDNAISDEQFHHFSWQNIQRDCIRIHFRSVDRSHKKKCHETSEILHFHTKTSSRRSNMSTNDHEAKLRSQTSINTHESRWLCFIAITKNYFIFSSDILRKKLFQQYAESFKIIEKVDNLVYRLNFSKHWRIHFVIFVAQLKSCSNSISNSYKRSRSNESESIHVDENIDQVKFFEIERLINKRHTAIRKSKYLIRWNDYASQHDEWRSVSELENAKNFIHEYETFMNNVMSLSDRLSRTTSFVLNSIAIITTISSNNQSQSKNSVNIDLTSARRSERKRKSRERD